MKKEHRDTTIDELIKNEFSIYFSTIKTIDYAKKLRKYIKYLPDEKKYTRETIFYFKEGISIKTWFDFIVWNILKEELFTNQNDKIEMLIEEYSKFSLIYRASGVKRDRIIQSIMTLTKNSISVNLTLNTTEMQVQKYSELIVEASFFASELINKKL